MISKLCKTVSVKKTANSGKTFHFKTISNWTNLLCGSYGSVMMLWSFSSHNVNNSNYYLQSNYIAKFLQQKFFNVIFHGFPLVSLPNFFSWYTNLTASLYHTKINCLSLMWNAIINLFQI